MHLHIYGEVTSETSYPSDSHVFIFNRPCYLCIMTTLYSTSTLTRVESCNPVYTSLLKTFSIVFAHFIVFCIHLLKTKTCYSKMTTWYGVKHYISLILSWRGFTMTHTHTHTYTTFGRTPLDEWSVRHRELPDNTQHPTRDIYAVGGIRPAIPASERLQTLALDRAATGIGRYRLCSEIFGRSKRNFRY